MPDGLHICPQCSSDLVYPVKTEEYPAHYSVYDQESAWHYPPEPIWHVILRCPNCESWFEGQIDDTLAQNFDNALAKGDEDLRKAYQAICAINMEDEIASFTRALDADAIMPEDF